VRTQHTVWHTLPGPRGNWGPTDGQRAVREWR
jgi:hypothetical protein